MMVRRSRLVRQRLHSRESLASGCLGFAQLSVGMEQLDLQHFGLLAIDQVLRTFRIFLQQLFSDAHALLKGCQCILHLARPPLEICQILVSLGKRSPPA